MTLHGHQIDDRSIVENGGQCVFVPKGAASIARKTCWIPVLKFLISRVAHRQRKLRRHACLRGALVAESLVGVCQRRYVWNSRVQSSVVYR
jgi:hypothetical protein